MGCAPSRGASETPLVALCRDRRDLIRAAAERRYALAAAHAAYFRSLALVGDALHRFAADELAPPPPSPLLTIPSSEGKVVSGGSPSSSPEGSHLHFSSEDKIVSGESPEGSHLHFSSEGKGESPEGSHLHFSSSDSEGEDSVEEDAEGGKESPSSTPPPPLSNNPIPNYHPYYYYMRSSSAIPYMVYEDPYAYSQYDSYYTNQEATMGPSEERESAPPPPQLPPGSTWDFFNPFFGSDEQYLQENYQGGYGIGSYMSSPNSSEVREMEGIPDLEDDTGQEQPTKEARKGEKDHNAGSSRPAPSLQKGGKVVLVEEKESKSGSVEIKSETESGSAASKDRSPQEGGVHTRKVGVEFSGETSLVTEESGPSNENSLSVHGKRDFLEVVDEVKEQFKSAAGFGEEVSRMLEVGTLRYRSRWKIFEVICCGIFNLMGPPYSVPSFSSFKSRKLSGASTLKNGTSHADFEKHTSMRSGNLSSTLDKLCMWEKKLYKEVKDEEKLYAIYDKKCKLLKALDDRGAEFYKIDSTRASIRKYSTQLSVVIKSIDSISSRMHKLRDEELLPQLVELIHGLIRMWRSVLSCHQRQFQAIIDSKIHTLIAKTSTHRKSVAKATVELEKQLLVWQSSFQDWISTQKAYVESLNGWLMKWLLQEPEETPDGPPPVSPTGIGAPAAFTISNDWYHAIESISEAEVRAAMQSFAASVHNLWQSQDEERRQKLKAEYLSRDFALQLKSLGREGMNGSLDVPTIGNDDLANQDARMVALASLRKRLDEERAKHEETIRLVQETASSSIRVSLGPIFEALGHFSLATLKAYEGIRIPMESGGN